MKNWPYILIVVIVVVICGYLVYSERDRLGLHLPWESSRTTTSAAASASSGSGSDADSGSNTSDNSAAQTAASAVQTATAAIADAAGASNLHWQPVSRPQDGFKVELPDRPKSTEAPATNENGGTEQIKMLTAALDGDVTYAVTWRDNPPVARANNGDADSTLDQARDGMLTRTQTTLMSETRVTASGFPGREILARNTQGGLLNARIIYVGGGSAGRLYTLMALFPTAGARREQDVSRFFNSFAIQSVPRG